MTPERDELARPVFNRLIWFRWLTVSRKREYIVFEALFNAKEAAVPDKIKPAYSSPVADDFSGRKIRGSGSPGCVSGSQANSLGESCGNGPNADLSCSVGGVNDYEGEFCHDGSSPANWGDCFNGNIAEFSYCNKGTGASGVDPAGCRFGPSN